MNSRAAGQLTNARKCKYSIRTTTFITAQRTQQYAVIPSRVPELFIAFYSCWIKELNLTSNFSATHFIIALKL